MDHAIQFYMTNIQQFETFWLALKIQLRVVGQKKEGGKRERYSVKNKPSKSPWLLCEDPGIKNGWSLIGQITPHLMGTHSIGGVPKTS
jgi:hypothetical protein